MSIELRPARLNDADALYKLICELKQTTFDRDAFLSGLARNLDDPQLFYQLALLDNHPVGMISLQMQFHLHHVRWIGEVQELVVMPEARGHNIGQRLLAWAEGKAREWDAELLELSCGALRKDAHRFYLREGHEPTHMRFTKRL